MGNATGEWRREAATGHWGTGSRLTDMLIGAARDAIQKSGRMRCRRAPDRRSSPGSRPEFTPGHRSNRHRAAPCPRSPSAEQAQAAGRWSWPAGGRHRPICGKHLSTLERLMDAFARAGAEIVAVSGDPEPKAVAMVEDCGLTFPVGNDLSVPRMRELEPYIPDPRSPEESDRPDAGENDDPVRGTHALGEQRPDSAVRTAEAPPVKAPRFRGLRSPRSAPRGRTAPPAALNGSRRRETRRPERTRGRRLARTRVRGFPSACGSPRSKA